jgi:pyruvate dehydrogenase (quinone)/pyruvate oxidase
VVPREEDLQRAAEVLNEGQRVVVLAGIGARGATNELLAAADLLGAPIIKSLSGKQVAPDAHPLVAGGLGLLGTRPSEEAIEACDTMFMVGTNFPYTAYLPPDRKAVQIELDPTRVGSRMPVDVPLVGDARETLAALIPLLQRKEDRSFLEALQEGRRRWDEEMAALATPDREPIQPQYLMKVIDDLADDDAILDSDSGTCATWAARHFEIRGNREFYLSGNLASMAPGLPYAIAHQAAFPNRQCIAFVGDGGFAMLMAEFHTAAWHELPVKVVICNNALLGQILWEQLALGYPEYGVRYPAMDFARWAESCGGRGIRVEKPGDLEPAIREAFEYDGPALVDVMVNPDEPPMPPKVQYDKAKGFMASFLKGTPRRASIASTVARDKLDQWT